MQKFLNTVREFTRGEEDKDNFNQKSLKVCEVFQVKPLKTPKPDVPSRKTVCNLFWKNIRNIKKELQGAPVSKASITISKEWKKVKARENKRKKCKDLYKEEKQWHKEVLQKYQEDHMDEMEIVINIHKRLTRRLGRFYSLKNHQSHTNLMDLKKYQSPLLIQAKNRSLKKHSRPADRKKFAKKAGQKLKSSHSRTKHQNHLNLLTQVRKKKKGCPRTIKRKKYLLWWGWKKKSKVFLILGRTVKIWLSRKRWKR